MQNLPVKLSGFGVFSFERSLATDSIALVDRGIFTLLVLGEDLIVCGFQEIGPFIETVESECVESSLIVLLMSVGSVVMAVFYPGYW